MPNALVRANYVNYSKNVTATPLFLERFFDNLLFGAKYELHNRDMHISKCQSDTENSQKCQIVPLDVTLEEKVLLSGYKAQVSAHSLLVNWQPWESRMQRLSSQ